MENLSLNLKLFYIEDGEDYFILANNESEARNYYENSGVCIDEIIKKEMLQINETDDMGDYYTIEELTKDTDREISINENIDLKVLLHEYGIDNKNSLNVYTYAKYFVLSKEIIGEELETPVIIAGSIFY